MADATSIVLADDHQVLRQSLRALLEREPDFRVVGEAGDGLTTIDIVERLMPNVVVLDVMLPKLNGIDVAHQIKKRFERTRIVILSMFPDESHVLRALANGASAYVVKAAAYEDLVRAIREVMADRKYLSPPLSDTAIRSYEESAKLKPFDRYDALTAREKQVLQLVAEGLSSAKVAERLRISTRTAETHRFNLSKKLGFHGPADLIAFALRRGLIARDT